MCGKWLLSTYIDNNILVTLLLGIFHREQFLFQGSSFAHPNMICKSLRFVKVPVPMIQMTSDHNTKTCFSLWIGWGLFSSACI